MTGNTSYPEQFPPERVVLSKSNESNDSHIGLLTWQIVMTLSRGSSPVDSTLGTVYWMNTGPTASVILIQRDSI